jgi:2,4-dienoyl-CoA reductase-like NADH-dependent reductase (Old Yellow Enzyme family)
MSKLFSPLELRGVRLPNRVMISPMCQYSGHEGMPSTWHTVHLGKLAQGGAGCVMLEATAVEKRGRITLGDLGLWDDGFLPGLGALAALIAAHGSVPAIQIGHAGRKASSQRPWHGNGPLTEADVQARLEMPWPTVAPSAVPMDTHWPVPRALSVEEIDALVQAFAAAAWRAKQAGFRLIELHMAHGYLLHSFLSPLSNRREDRYGGPLQNRLRLPLAIAQAVRAAVGEDVALSARLSTVDGIEGGWMIEDSVVLARALKAAGIDLIDCSSGGIAGPATAATGKHAVKRYPGFQVPFADTIRREAEVPTIAVGLITEAEQAEAVVAEGRADIVAIGRQALYEPNWPLHTAMALGVDPGFERWSPQYGWWLARRTGHAGATPR